MKFLRTIILTAATLLIALHLWAQPQLPNIQSQDIVILYDNDVHCAIDGYAKIAGVRDHVLETTSNVNVVSCGDFVGGKALGTVSRGEYIISVMNAVHYDYVTIGNHEFDFGIPQMTHLFNELNSNVLCCNYTRIGEPQPIYDGYAIQDFGGKKVAFVGVATPGTISTSTPAFFKDDNQNFIYSFGDKNVVETVQSNVDAARHDGADYVVVLAHLGIDPPDLTSTELIAQTTGIDVVLDGHSHSIIESQLVNNRDGKPVNLTSTGTAFTYVGILVIGQDGNVTTALLKTEDIPYKNEKVQQEIDRIYQDYKEVGGRHIGYSEAELRISGNDGVRIVRTGECSMGDFVADAMLAVTGAQIAWMNSGGCRNNIPAGEINLNSVISATPFYNEVYLCKIPGQDLMDALEMAVSSLPAEGGVFPQIAGFRFEVDTTIASPAKMNRQTRIFDLSDGPRRITKIEIYDKKKGKYVKFSPKKTYTIAGTSYSLVDNGDGLKFPHLKIIKRDYGVTFVVLEKYITEYLNGKIGKERAETAGRIKIISHH